MDLILDLNYFSFFHPNPTHLPKHQTIALSPNHQFSQRIWYVEYYSVHVHMAWSQKFRLTPDSHGLKMTDRFNCETKSELSVGLLLFLSLKSCLKNKVIRIIPRSNGRQKRRGTSLSSGVFVAVWRDANSGKINALDLDWNLKLNNSQTAYSFSLDQLCPTQMAYWVKNYITILTRAAHWMTY